MGKKYKGKTCVYCCTPNVSQTGDHVVARKFFLDRRRRDLPKVPACTPCNTAKSGLETYLTSVMPFGGLHPNAHETLSSMLPRRLEKNPTLHRSLAEGTRYSSLAAAAGSASPSAMTVAPDSELLKKL